MKSLHQIIPNTQACNSDVLLISMLLTWIQLYCSCSWTLTSIRDACIIISISFIVIQQLLHKHQLLKLSTNGPKIMNIEC